MKTFSNQRGSVMLMVLIIAVVFAAVALDLSTRFTSIVREHQKFSTSNENFRVADELSKVVARAYERGSQSATCPTGSIEKNFGTAHFCFLDNDEGKCTFSAFNTGNKVCLDLTTTTNKNIGRLDDGVSYQLKAYLPPQKSKSWFIQSLIPDASADALLTAMPPPPSGPVNAFVDYTCGTGVDPALCRKCGASAPNICFQILFCPADRGTSCSAADLIRMDMMIERRAVSTVPSCPAQTMFWGACSAPVTLTTANSTATANDSTATDMGSATYRCDAAGNWIMAPLSSSCAAGGSTLCWVANTRAPGECAPPATGCTAAGLTASGVQCYTDNGNGTVATTTDTMTCTAVGSASDPRCQTRQNRNHCFTAGTAVTMADGSAKAIETIRAGEKVRTVDPETGHFEEQLVKAEIHHAAQLDRIYSLTLDNGQTIETNGEHRFFDVGSRDFVSISKLADRFENSNQRVQFLGDNAKILTLVHVSSEMRNVKLYNLTIDQTHTYFAGGVLVHNEKRVCDVDTAAQCSLPGCVADYSYPRFYKCRNVSESVINAFQYCLANKPDLCPP